MDLPWGLTPAALAAATAEDDPSSLAAAQRLRRAFDPPLAAAALHQVSLRRRARVKFGDAADAMFFTPAGLEQATRPELADHHARRFRAAGARRVVDLGCGIGADAMAFVRAGLEVLAIDRDPLAAAAAAANLRLAQSGGGYPASTVACADAAAVVAQHLRPDDAVFLDPARRTERGRLWRVADFTPPWALVTGLLAGGRPVGVKLGPALPHAAIPPAAEAEWVSHHGDVVEVGLWSGPGSVAGRHSALLWPDDRLVTEAAEPLPVGDVGAYLYEPDGAVIRARGVAQLGATLGARLLDPQIAYLTGDDLVETPYATAFRVAEVGPFDVRSLRRRLRTAGIGNLEIKKRGVDVDPAQLRRQLSLAGSQAATLLVSRTPSGAVAVLASRVPRP